MRERPENRSFFKRIFLKNCLVIKKICLLLQSQNGKQKSFSFILSKKIKFVTLQSVKQQADVAQLARAADL